ncbi:xanthine dehydrogenase family protein molybdopterin-binding subunit [Litoribacillus peritrichatus]|uniref:Xanthine dehydrogenase family protein molybdopterin-binding subunit n=1 Tax=Litoribacillus peritrichatus TaxID=718191 RepID=A0ABP7N4E9_9GAMM
MLHKFSSSNVSKVRSSESGISRRSFLITSAQSSAGLVLGMALPLSQAQAKTESAVATTKTFTPNAFVSVDSSNKVIITIKHLEMGQGTFTGLATLVAEELDADWSQVECRGAEANTEHFANTMWGKFQGTGGSTAIANSYSQMRNAGATARAMLVSAAATLWRVPVSEISVEQGEVLHKSSGKRVSFGTLAELAALQKVPSSVNLKDPANFKLIGRKVPRKDVGKTSGKAIFTQDIQRPDQLTAMVAHPPKFGATLKSFDASQAKKVPGVEAVVAIPNGVAVLAKDYWAAKTAREQLSIQWDESKAFQQSSDDIMKEYKALAEKPGLLAAESGDVDKGFTEAAQIIEAEYEFPYLAHATMEPMNCVVQIKAGANGTSGAELWYGAQIHTGDQMAVAGVLGIKPDQVKINTLFAGGSFGRRGNSHSDYVVEAVQVAKAHGKGVPVKLVWSREDDTQAGYYRPMYFHKLKAGLDKSGNLVAWQHRIVGQSIVKGTGFEGMIQNGIDHTSVEGASNLPYGIPNKRVELHTTENQVPILWWRSVGSTHTAHATESFLDEVAKAANKDPLELRMALLKDHPRHSGVLELAAKQANWAAKRAAGKSVGVAVHKSFGTYVAQVVEVAKTGEGYKVEHVTCAVDCGVTVNPDVIKAQMEGGIGYGLSPALLSEVTFKQGKVVQSNFHDYQVIRMKDMPAIDVHIVPSTEPPTGVGEPGTPVIAPALANALVTAGAEREYRLPLKTPLV